MELRELPTKKQEEKTYNSHKKAQKAQKQRREQYAVRGYQ